MTAKTLSVPTIHMNGTSGEELISQLTYALRAVSMAREAVAAASPNARDYYPKGPESYSLAVQQAVAREQKLREVGDELSQLLEAVIEEVDLRTIR